MPQVTIGAAYIRVSTDDQTELSPDAQLRVILERSKSDGVTIPPEFIFIEKTRRRARFTKESCARSAAWRSSACPNPSWRACSAA